MKKLIRLTLTTLAAIAFILLIPTNTKAATYEETQQAAVKQFNEALTAKYQAQVTQQLQQLQQAQLTEYQAVLNAQALQTAQYQLMTEGNIAAQANALAQYNAVKAAQATQLAQYDSMMQAESVNQIACFTEAYKQEQQRAINAYLGYWGLK